MTAIAAAAIYSRINLDASRFSLQFLHPDFVGARHFIPASDAKQKGAAGEIFTLQFGHVITLDISTRSVTDAP